MKRTRLLKLVGLSCCLSLLLAAKFSGVSSNAYEATDYWAFRKPVRPAVPTVKKSVVNGMKINFVTDELFALIVRLWPFHKT